jgi:glutathione S-transferase
MILYGSSFSPFVRKVMAYASEKGIDGDDNPEFRRASPMGKMPGFTDGDFAISDSTAIITYLEAKIPEPPLLPADPASRARVIWFEEFADTIMTQTVFKCFFNRIVAPKFMKIPGDEALAVEGETQDLPKLLDYLETVVPNAGGFLVGTSISIADLAVASPFVNFDHAACAVDKGKWPRTYAWVESIHARPSFAPVIAMEQKILGRM